MKTPRIIVILVPALLAAAPVLGQDMPISDAPEINRWLPIGISFVLIVAVLVASFTSSRRGHQD